MSDRAARDEAATTQQAGVDLPSAARAARSLRWTLRCLAIVCFAAACGLFAPQWGLAKGYALLGISELASGKLFELLLRVSCASIGVLGGVMWIASTDAKRYWTLVTFIAISFVTVAVALVLIDIHQNLPWPWLLVGAPALGVVGIAMLVLNVRCWGD